MFGSNTCVLGTWVTATHVVAAPAQVTRGVSVTRVTVTYLKAIYLTATCAVAAFGSRKNGGIGDREKE